MVEVKVFKKRFNHPSWYDPTPDSFDSSSGMYDTVLDNFRAYAETNQLEDDTYIIDYDGTLAVIKLEVKDPPPVPTNKIYTTKGV